MEIELKYGIASADTIDDIFDDILIEKYRDEDEASVIPMEAIYYDTESLGLSAKNIAFRIRKEGKKYIATVKWNDSCDDGLYKREELNIQVSEEMSKNPEISIFSESEISDVLEEAAAGEKLVPLIEMNFVRREIRIDTGKSISVLSADIGEIHANSAVEPILELELELYSGDETDMTSLGKQIADKYGLKPENRSKFERGMKLYI